MKSGRPFVSFRKLAADAVQHFAVLTHGLGQILDDRVLHNKIPPKKECENSVFINAHRGGGGW